MNIVVLGAGAIGSLYGSLLSKKNYVTLIGSPKHINAIKKKGLTIKGKTQSNIKISAEVNIKKLEKSPELLILTVKSYDTVSAIRDIDTIINKNTTILSLQNGLDNIEKIKKIIDNKQIIAGTTTHGAFLVEPGIVEHTGLGNTILGELDGKILPRLKKIVKIFNNSLIKTHSSKNIIKEIWIKAIINSSINPLTTIFKCRNGYLLENPVLEQIVNSVCRESTIIANKNGIIISTKYMREKTKEVIRSTSENYSSMFQSFKNNKKTEIDSINGKLAFLGKIHNVDTSLNDILVDYIKTNNLF